MIDNKLTPRDVKNIMLLNQVMNNNELYRAITGTDVGCVNHLNIHICTRLLELHTYLIKHYELIPNIFTEDMYSNYNNLQSLINILSDNNNPIASVLKNIGIIK